MRAVRNRQTIPALPHCPPSPRRYACCHADADDAQRQRYPSAERAGDPAQKVRPENVRRQVVRVKTWRKGATHAACAPRGAHLPEGARKERSR